MFYAAWPRAHQWLYNESFLKQANVPLQVLPSPVYPALHAHAYDPTVLLQIALTSQLWSLLEHSSTSENITLLEIWEIDVTSWFVSEYDFCSRVVKNQKQNERDKGAWVSDSSQPENIKIVQRNQPWSNLFIVFVLIDITKVLLLHYRSRDKINTNTTIAERDIITTSNITYILQRFLKCLNLFSISPRKSENLIFKSYISHNTTSLKVQWECSNTFRTVKTYQVQTCTKFQEKSLN